MKCFTLPTLIIALALAAAPSLLAGGDSWCTFSGKVIDVDDDSITLDHGDGSIDVSNADWKWYGEVHTGLRGNEIRVCGHLLGDSGKPVLKPTGIFLEDRHTYHHARGIDASAAAHGAMTWVKGAIVFTGKVVSVEGLDFTLEIGERKITVSTRELHENPLDDVGHQQIKAGDRVIVSADIEREFFEQGRIRADRVVSLIGDLPD